MKSVYVLESVILSHLPSAVNCYDNQQQSFQTSFPISNNWRNRKVNHSICCVFWLHNNLEFVCKLDHLCSQISRLTAHKQLSLMENKVIKDIPINHNNNVHIFIPP